MWNVITTAYTPKVAFAPRAGFSLRKLTATNIRLHRGRLYDGYKIETPRMDKRPSSHVEGVCEKEKTGG
jgi:hypothetical protein